MSYDPRKDHGVRKLREVRNRTDAVKHTVEKQLVTQTENGKKPKDPPQRVRQK
jgi:hypothetical protein